jgi:hypothetical protein
VDDHFDRTFLTTFTVKAYVIDVRFERLFSSDILERVKQTVLRRQLLTEATILGFLASERS